MISALNDTCLIYIDPVMSINSKRRCLCQPWMIWQSFPKERTKFNKKKQTRSANVVALDGYTSQVSMRIDDSLLLKAWNGLISSLAWADGFPERPWLVPGTEEVSATLNNIGKSGLSRSRFILFNHRIARKNQGAGCIWNGGRRQAKIVETKYELEVQFKIEGGK